MARRAPISNWGTAPARSRTETQLQTLVTATKLRTLADMSEKEIRALEKLYGMPIQRPARAKPAARKPRPAARKPKPRRGR